LAKLVTRSVEDGIAYIRLCRPDNLNALSEDLKTQLIDAFESIDVDQDINIVVVSGEGRAFCVGADKDGFANIANATRKDVTDSLELGDRLIRTMLDCNAIIICAVHGYCIGGGLSIALAADISLCSEDALFFAPEIDLGLPYLWGSTALLASAVGRQQANRLIYTCDQISATEAKHLGIISDVFSPADLANNAKELAVRLCKKPSHALLSQKQLSNRYTQALIAHTGNEVHEGLRCMGVMHPQVIARSLDHLTEVK